MNIDHKEAPKGATHWSDANHGNRNEAYWKPNGGGYDCFCPSWVDARWQGLSEPLPDYAVRITTAAWTGEGLPPVGTVCTIDCETPHKRWKKHVGEQVVIIAHSTGYEGNPTAVYKVFDAEDSEYHALREQAFRPIRTPEQIAAEEYELDAEEIAKILSDLDGADNTFIAKTLLDCGYSKKVAP